MSIDTSSAMPRTQCLRLMGMAKPFSDPSMDCMCRTRNYKLQAPGLLFLCRRLFLVLCVDSKHADSQDCHGMSPPENVAVSASLYVCLLLHPPSPQSRQHSTDHHRGSWDTLHPLSPHVRETFRGPLPWVTKPFRVFHAH